MKAKLWTVLILLAVILALGILSGRVSAEISQKFSRQMEEVEAAARSGEWAAGQTALGEMLLEWEETTRWLHYFINHQDTEEVGIAMEKMAAALEMENLLLFLMSQAELAEGLRHIHYRDALALGNLL